MSAHMIFENELEKSGHLRSLVDIPSINPKSYNESDNYDRLDFIDHAQYGVGFVEKVLSRNEVKVFFFAGSQKLKHNLFAKIY